MAGYLLTEGDIADRAITQSDVRTCFDNFFSSKSRKETTYKFAIIYSMLKNLNHINNQFQIPYVYIFEPFVQVYWGLVWEYKLSQIKKGAVWDASAIERIINSAATKAGLYNLNDFNRVPTGVQQQIIIEAKAQCKRNVFGALYKDTGELVYGFSNENEMLWLNPPAYEYMLNNLNDIHRENIHEWAVFLAGNNSLPAELSDEDISVSDKISYFRDILKKCMNLEV